MLIKEVYRAKAIRQRETSETKCLSLETLDLFYEHLGIIPNL